MLNKSSNTCLCDSKAPDSLGVVTLFSVPMHSIQQTCEMPSHYNNSGYSDVVNIANNNYWNCYGNSNNSDVFNIVNHSNKIHSSESYNSDCFASPVPVPVHARAQMILSPTPVGLMAMLATLPKRVIFTTWYLTRLLSSTPVGLEIIRFSLNVLVWPQPPLNHQLGHPKLMTSCKHVQKHRL